MFSWCFMRFCLFVRVIILLFISVVVYACNMPFILVFEI